MQKKEILLTTEGFLELETELNFLKPKKTGYNRSNQGC